MTNSEKDVSKSQTPTKNIHEESDSCEDEINLIDYFTVLWRRKSFILIGSVLPTLVVGLIFFLWPRYYKITYTYDTGLDEKGYKTLLNRVFCTENLDKVITRLKENGLEKYARQITEAQRLEDLKKFVNLEVSPSFFGSTGSSGKTNVEDLQKIQWARGALLIMTIRGKPQKDIHTIASVVRDDFEKVVPLYSVKDGLISDVNILREQMADIEEGRFDLELELQKNKATLEKLKSEQQSAPEWPSSNIILQFNDASANSAYMPLACQIQAANSQIIRLEEGIRVNEEKFDYYKDLLGINEKILNEIKDKISSYYTIQEFHSFLNNVIKDYKDKKLVDYLDAYIKRIENKIASIVPITKSPKVYPVAKGTVRKSGIVFMVALIISTFTVFLLEGLKKNRALVS